MRSLATRRATLGIQKVRGGAVLSLASAIGCAMLTAGALTAGLGASRAEAKTPGKTYCYNRVCHRVKTLAETRAMVGGEETLHTSYYDDCRKDRLNPCGLTSSGEVFRANTPDNAASPIYPNGTVLLIWSPATKKSAVVRVNNAGPYWRNRKLDVSRAAAQKLGFAGRGVAKLKVRVLSAPTRAEASYKRKRRYTPVPGYIGSFASLDKAHIGAAQTYAVAALTAPAADTEAATAVALASAQAETETLAAEQSGPQEAVAVKTVAVADAAKETAVGATETSKVETPSMDLAAVDDAHEIEPVKVATLVDAVEVSDTETQWPPNSARNMTGEPVRVGDRADRSQPRNSRTYRKQRQQSASKQTRRQDAPPAPQIATRVPAPRSVAPRSVFDPRPITRDATNDISVFSRHMHTGASRLAAGDVTRRNAY